MAYSGVLEKEEGGGYPLCITARPFSREERRKDRKGETKLGKENRDSDWTTRLPIVCAYSELLQGVTALFVARVLKEKHGEATEGIT